MNAVTRGALAGVVGAAAWAGTEPVLGRMLRTRYTDVEYTGRLVTHGRAWHASGVAAHTAVGAALGAAMASAGVADVRRSIGVMQAENALAWPCLALLASLRAGSPSRPRLGDARRFVQCAAVRAVYASVYALSLQRLPARTD